MVQTTNRFFDEVARLMNDAAGAAQGMRREAETMFRTQAERLLREFAVVQREEFEAVKDMARLAREENEALKVRLAALEARLGVSSTAPAGGSSAASGSAGSASGSAGSWGSSGASSSSASLSSPGSSSSPETPAAPSSGGAGTDGPSGGYFG
jgi:BMFP domain-containing protein YqiC